MTCYIVAEINIHDRDGYTKYEQGFMAVFEKYSGSILAVDESPLTLEGQWPHTRTVILAFPSEADAMAWYQSEEYQALAKHRLDSSEGSIAIIHGFG